MEGARVAAACHGGGAFQILLPATLPEYAGMENATGSHKKCIKMYKDYKAGHLDIAIVSCRTAPGFNVLCTRQWKILHK